MNTCACGCGELVPKTWKQGHNPKTLGLKYSDETRQKISESMQGRFTGEKHYNWGKQLPASTRKKIGDAHRGKEIPQEMRDRVAATKAQRYGVSDTREAIHVWLLRHFPKTGICEHCGVQCRTTYASMTNHQYTRNREDYAELCYPCHLKHDYATGQRRTTKGTRHRKRRVRMDAP